MLDTRSIKIGINTAVFLLLLLPPAAAVLSPKFPEFLEAVVKDHNTAGLQLEALRRATPASIRCGRGALREARKRSSSCRST